jgi:hypothetical protein
VRCPPPIHTHTHITRSPACSAIVAKLLEDTQYSADAVGRIRMLEAGDECGACLPLQPSAPGGQPLAVPAALVWPGVA